MRPSALRGWASRTFDGPRRVEPSALHAFEDAAGVGDGGDESGEAAPARLVLVRERGMEAQRREAVCVEAAEVGIGVGDAEHHGDMGEDASHPFAAGAFGRLARYTAAGCRSGGSAGAAAGSAGSVVAGAAAGSGAVVGWSPVASSNDAEQLGGDGEDERGKEAEDPSQLGSQGADLSVEVGLRLHA